MCCCIRCHARILIYVTPPPPHFSPLFFPPLLSPPPKGVGLEFDDDAVREVARIASEVNRTVENIGARRLFSVMERIMDDHSFDAADLDEGEKIHITATEVRDKVEELLEKSDMSKYII